MSEKEKKGKIVKKVVWYRDTNGEWYSDEGLSYYINENKRLKKEIEELKKENAFLKELYKKPEGFNSITRTGGNIE